MVLEYKVGIIADVVRNENFELNASEDFEYGPQTIIRRSPAMKEVWRFINRISRTDATVLITGESGTGKELVARAIHSSGVRKKRKLIYLHCSTMVKAGESWDDIGSICGGLFEEAGGGTLVLNEIGDMDPAVQTRFLAYMDRGKGGGSQPMIIATSNKDLSTLQREGKFRPDLFHRLNMFSLRLPSLRERKEDIPPLAELFFSQYKYEFGKQRMRLSPDAMKVLQNYDWPGNVRELKSLLAAVCLLQDSIVIKPDHLLQRLPRQHELLCLPVSLTALEHIEKKLITETLRSANGNMVSASKVLNITYETLRYRIKKFRINRKAYKSKSRSRGNLSESTVMDVSKWLRVQ